MFSTNVVAINDLPESHCALLTAIDLASLYNAELATVSILGDRPAYTSFSVVAYPGASAAMMEEHRERHMEMHEKAAILARELGVHAQGSIRAILHFLKEQNADLLVLGLHQHDFYLSHLWSSVYDLAQDASIGALTGSHAVFCRKRATVDNRLDHVANSHP